MQLVAGVLTVVKITVGRQLKSTDGRELPIKKVTENPTLTDRFIIFYPSCKY